MIIILTSPSEIRHSRPTQKGEWRKKEERKQKLKHVVQISLAVHTDVWLHTLQISVVVSAAVKRSPPRWSLLLQGRSLHGNHYSRFHVLNKRDCGTGKETTVLATDFCQFNTILLYWHECHANHQINKIKWINQ